MKEKIIVTGGAGFIGSHVVDGLLAEGYAVLVVDNLSTGQRENVAAEAEFLEMDVRDPGLLMALADCRAKAIIHMAAQASVSVSTQQPLQDADINIKGSLSMLQAAVKLNIPRFVYTSSAAVYGNPQFLPITEDHPVAPISNYGVSKYVPEHYLAVFAQQFALKTCALRLGNVYGPRQNAAGEAGVVAIFLNQILRGQIPVIHGDGEQSRDFIYVEDVAKAFVQAVSSEVTGPLNISTQLPTTVNQLYAEMQKACQFWASAEPGPIRTGDIRSSILANGRAKEDLSWRPKWSLQDGIEATANYYAKRNNF